MKISYLTLLATILVGSISCTNGLETGNGFKGKVVDSFGCSIGPSSPAVTEPSFCSQVVVPADPVTITGSATYQRRIMSTGGLLGPSAGISIRDAEIAVVDSTGTVIQCGETDSSGNFSVQVPRSSSSYSLQVRSRSNNSSLKASILNNHGDMSYYKISNSFTPDSSKSIGTLNASYQGSLEGGAFNILDKLHDANSYLKTNTTSCASITGCTPFDVAPKVQVFWEPGCNPGAYFNIDPVSFYLSGESRMYILGGEDGDVNYSDTDHFDDIIIIHEYGHFIEDIYSKSDSPGGFHDANTIVDPRLAWSEAWASFLAASVRGISYYIDTYGNSSGSTGTFFSYNIETNVPKRDPSSIGYIVPSGEGNFREFGILRALWDIMDLDASDTDNDGVEASMNEVWASFAGSSGIKNEKFLSVGTFFEKFNALASTNVSSILNDEKILPNDTAPADADNRLYAVPLKTVGGGGTQCSISITPANGNNFVEDGKVMNTNLFASNDFYLVTIPGLSGNTFTLDITGGSGDLDLYLFQEDHMPSTLSNTRVGVIASSTSKVSGVSTETITTSLSAGTYLLNVHSYTGGGLNSNTYEIRINGVQQCL